jgi:hypothetical protein
MAVELAAVVLAAGAGTRLWPLTGVRPKALCPVATIPLVDHMVTRVRALTSMVAVNVHHHPEAMLAHLANLPVHVSHEQRQALGSAGALGFLREWIDGRAVVVTNADTWMADGLTRLVEGWDGRRIRLLVAPDELRPDFDKRWRFMGASLMSWSDLRDLRAERSGLYNERWRRRYAEGMVEFVVASGACCPCDTPAEYLTANQTATKGASAVDSGAIVEGIVDRSVVWPGARVLPGEHLVEAIRATDTLTVYPFR